MDTDENRKYVKIFRVGKQNLRTFCFHTFPKANKCLELFNKKKTKNVEREVK